MGADILLPGISTKENVCQSSMHRTERWQAMRVLTLLSIPSNKRRVSNSMHFAVAFRICWFVWLASDKGNAIEESAYLTALHAAQEWKREKNDRNHRRTFSIDKVHVHFQRHRINSIRMQILCWARLSCWKLCECIQMTNDAMAVSSKTEHIDTELKNCIVLLFRLLILLFFFSLLCLFGVNCLYSSSARHRCHSSYIIFLHFDRPNSIQKLLSSQRSNQQQWRIAQSTINTILIASMHGGEKKNTQLKCKLWRTNNLRWPWKTEKKTTTNPTRNIFTDKAICNLRNKKTRKSLFKIDEKRRKQNCHFQWFSNSNKMRKVLDANYTTDDLMLPIRWLSIRPFVSSVWERQFNGQKEKNIAEMHAQTPFALNNKRKSFANAVEQNWNVFSCQ